MNDAQKERSCGEAARKKAGAVGLFVGWPLTAIWLGLGIVVMALLILVALVARMREPSFPSSPMWGVALVLTLLL